MNSWGHFRSSKREKKREVRNKRVGEETGTDRRTVRRKKYRRPSKLLGGSCLNWRGSRKGLALERKTTITVPSITHFLFSVFFFFFCYLFGLPCRFKNFWAGQDGVPTLQTFWRLKQVDEFNGSLEPLSTLPPPRTDTGPETLNDAGAHLRSVLPAYFVIVWTSV